MIQRGMFPCKMDAPFRLDDVFVQKRLLTGIKQGKRAAREGIIVPHVRCTRFKFISDLRMDHGDIFDGLFDPFVR